MGRGNVQGNEWGFIMKRLLTLSTFLVVLLVAIGATAAMENKQDQRKKKRQKPRPTQQGAQARRPDSARRGSSPGHKPGMDARFQHEMREMELKKKRLEMQAHQAMLEARVDMARLDVEERELDIKARKQKIDARWQEMERKQARFKQQQHGRDKLKSAIARRRRAAKKREEMFGSLFVLGAVVNVLLAIWVYQDIRKRNSGSGLWIVLALLAGFFGTLLYAIVRLGDVQQQSG